MYHECLSGAQVGNDQLRPVGLGLNERTVFQFHVWIVHCGAYMRGTLLAPGLSGFIPASATEMIQCIFMS